MNIIKKERLFFTSFALGLVESIRRNDIPLSVAYIDYLREVCNDLTINFDAPNYIGTNSKVIYTLSCLINLVALSLSL